MYGKEQTCSLANEMICLGALAHQWSPLVFVQKTYSPDRVGHVRYPQ